MKSPDLKDIPKKLAPVIRFLKRDAVGIFLIIAAIIFGFLIWRIGRLASPTPSQDAIDEKLRSVVRPQINIENIQAIERLEDQNIDIKSYFSDRDNPFQE